MRVAISDRAPALNRNVREHFVKAWPSTFDRRKHPADRMFRYTAARLGHGCRRRREPIERRNVPSLCGGRIKGPMAQISSRPAAREGAASADGQLRLAASVVIAAVLVAGVYFARPILVPLALAILLAFALAPAVTLLRRLHLGRVLSVVVATLLAIAIIGIVIAFIGTQLAHLAADLPRYQDNIAEKIHSFRTSASSNTAIGRLFSLFNNLDNQLSATSTDVRPHATGLAHALTGKGSVVPVPVEIHQPNASPIVIIGNIFRPLIDPLATAGIAIIFVVFILLQKEDLRDRFIWMAGSRDLQRATVALDDGAERLSRFLLTQTGINTLFGALVGTGLWLIGVPHPWLWGLVAAIFRFIPYVGVPLAAALPLMLSLAVDPGWAMMFWTAGLYLVLETITGQAIEPFLYGHSVGLSPVAIVVAATFWTWVWGPVGLLLSTPLTLCLAVLGHHVERLRFLDVLLGNRPPLAQEQSFYLRILAGDPDDAAGLAKMFLKRNSPAEYCDIALKALVLAQADASRGALDPDRCGSVRDVLDGVIQNLSDHEETPAADSAEPETDAEKIFTAETLPADWAGTPVLCVAGRSQLDEAAASLLVHLLEKRGIGARVVSADEVSAANIQQLDPAGVRFVCLSFLDPGSGTNAHYLMRRLRRRIPAIHSLTGYWGFSGDDGQYLNIIAATGGDVASSLCEAVDRIVASVGVAAPQPETPAPAPRKSEQRSIVAEAAAR